MVNIDSGYDIRAHKATQNIVVSPKLWLGHAYLIVMNRAAWERMTRYRDVQDAWVKKQVESGLTNAPAVLEAMRRKLENAQ